jgi:hypothetical protein
MKGLLPERTSAFFIGLIARNADIAQLIVRETRLSRAHGTGIPNRGCRAGDLCA